MIIIDGGDDYFDGTDPDNYDEDIFGPYVDELPGRPLEKRHHPGCLHAAHIENICNCRVLYDADYEEHG